MNTGFYLNILRARTEAADATEFYRKQSIDAQNMGDNARAESNRQKFVASQLVEYIQLSN